MRRNFSDRDLTSPAAGWAARSRSVRERKGLELHRHLPRVAVGTPRRRLESRDPVFDLIDRLFERQSVQAAGHRKPHPESRWDMTQDFVRRKSPTSIGVFPPILSGPGSGPVAKE
jgi:hypothetical protein